jgi:hypothetical protein
MCPPTIPCTFLYSRLTHTWFASGYRQLSRRLPVVVDVLDTTIFITILLARPFGEVVLLALAGLYSVLLWLQETQL